MACMRQCILLATLLVQASGVLLRNARAQQLTAHGNAAEGSSDLQSMKQRVADQWYELAGGLWSSILIQKATNSTFDFDATDSKAKKAFVDHCSETFDTHRSAVPDDVVRKMCARAGGTLDECSTMQDDLWAAYNKTQLVPWCEKTFDWFARKTAPRCLDKCPALYCKKRCSLYDKYQDMQDQEFAYMLRLNLTYTKEKRLNATKVTLDDVKVSFNKFNKTKVKPAKDEVANAMKLVQKIQDFMADNLNEGAITTAAKAKDKAEAALREAQEAERKDQSLLAAVDKAQKADGALSEEKRNMGAVQSRMTDVQRRLKDATSSCNAQEQRLKDSQALLEKEKKAITDYTTKLTTVEGEAKAAQAKAEDFKKASVDPAKAKVKAAVDKSVTLKARFGREQQALAQATSLYEDAKAESEEKAAVLAQVESTLSDHSKLMADTEAQIETATKDLKAATEDTDSYNTTTHMPLQEKLDKLDAIIKKLEDQIELEQRSLIKAEYQAGRAKADLRSAKSLNTWDSSQAAKDALQKSEEIVKVAEKALGDAQQAVKSLETRLMTVGADAEQKRTKVAKSSVELNKLLSAQKLAEQEAAALAEDLEKAQTKAKEIEKEFQDVKGSSDTAAADLKTAESKMTTSKDTVAATGLEIAKADDDEAAAKSALAPLEQQLQGLVKAADLKVKEKEDTANSLAKSKDEAKYLTGQVQEKQSGQDECSKSVKKLEATETSIKDDLSAAETAVKQAESKVTDLKKAVDTIQKDLLKAVNKAKTEADSASKKYAKVSEKKSEYNDKLLEAQGKLTKAKIVADQKEKTLTDMVADWTKSTETYRKEWKAVQERRKPIMDALTRLRSDMEPFKKALGPMLT